MSATLSGRLNQILPLITGDDFLSSAGIGNEIACYVFEYPATDELLVRQHVRTMMERLASHHGELSVLHLDLLDAVTAYLDQRGLLDKAIELQETKGDAGLLRALQGSLAAERIRDYIEAQYRPAERDLILLAGVGSVWPMLRAHSLLNCLHTVIGATPLVMFYPGRFDGTTLRLFGQIETATPTPGRTPYYRAFKLVSGGNE
jgi:hypothetical protein